MKTLLSGGVVVTVDDANSVYSTGDLVIEDENISYVGPSYAGEYDVQISAKGRLLMPGMINAHTHSAMTLLRTLSDDVDLFVFLYDRVWPREEKMTGEDVYAGALLADVEMLKSGVTTSVDMYFFPESLKQAAIDSGIRSLITPTILDVPQWTGILGPWEHQLARAVDFCLKSEGVENRIHTGIAPHAPYTLSMEALAEIAREARRIDRPLNIHLVETKRERDEFNERGIGSTARALQDVGFFEGSVLAAHSVWIDDGDVEIYWRGHVGVAHCPQSNAKLGAGIAPVAEMLAGGVDVGLGTDGASTNNNLILWEEMRMAPLLAKAKALDPKPLPAAQALALATRLGAQAIHLPQLGVLASGKKADIVMIDLKDTTAVPVFDESTYVSNIVYSMDRKMIDSVWVNGRRVVEEGWLTTLDEAAVRAAAQEKAVELARRAEN